MRTILLSVSVLLFAACGGGGGSEPTTVASLDVTPTGPELDTLVSFGATAQLIVVARDAGGSVVSANISYTSTNANVASINSSGRITAVNNGTTFVTVSSGSVSVQRTVVVKQKLASIALAPASVVLIPGLTRNLTIQPKDGRGNNMSGLPAPVFSSDNTAVATIDSEGIVTAEGLGNTIVRVSITTSSGTTTGTLPVQVIASFPLVATITLSSASFSPTEVDVGIGATVTFANGSATTHNVTFDGVVGAPANIGDHSSGNNARAFPAAGTFPYRCTIHTGMQGTIIVH